MLFFCAFCFYPLWATDSNWEQNNWAVVVGTSRYWYNYRHATNALVIYHSLKQRGFPDSHIILFLAEDHMCNARNRFPGTIFGDNNKDINLYEGEIEVDYRGEEVTVDNFLRVLSGRHYPTTPLNKRLLSDENSNVLVYITGHSGYEFIKFQDWEEMTSTDIANAFNQMYLQKRYKQVFWIADTCEASTLQNVFYSPGIVAIGSSARKQNSYSYRIDQTIGVFVIDRFTYYTLQFFNDPKQKDASIQQYLDYFSPDLLLSTPDMRADLFLPTKPGKTKMREFFAAAGSIHTLPMLKTLAAGNVALRRRHKYSLSKEVLEVAQPVARDSVAWADPLGWLKLVPLGLCALLVR